VKQTITYLILTLLFSLSILAQDESSSYTLDQLISEALENNYDIRVSRSDLEISELNNTIGNAGMLPSLMWESSLNNSFNDRYGDDNQNGSLQNGVRLNWLLFKGFSAHIRKDRLETMEQLSGGNLALVVENTVQAIVMAYYRALMAKEQLDLLNEVMQLSDDRLRYMEERQDLGAATSYEVLQARTSYLTDKTLTWNRKWL
jgi:outer membrane protein